jgi:hypothetical protein
MSIKNISIAEHNQGWFWLEYKIKENQWK